MTFVYVENYACINISRFILLVHIKFFVFVSGLKHVEHVGRTKQTRHNIVKKTLIVHGQIF